MRNGSIRHVRAIAACGLGALATFFGLSCSSADCRGGNEAGALLQSVPAPAYPVLAPLDVEEGSIVKQTWSIEGDGKFVVNRTIERRTGRLGCEVVPMDPKAAGEAGAEAYSGVLVRSVDREGAAARAGLLPGDALMGFDGKDVASPDRLAYLVERAAPGSAVELKVVRKGQTIALKGVVGEETRTVFSKAHQRDLPVIDSMRRTGMKLAELNDEVRPIVAPRAAAKGLIVIDLLPGGPAFGADLRVRDVIVAIDGRPVPTIADWASALDAAADGTRLEVSLLRNGAAIERSLHVVDDAGTSTKFNLLGLVKYDRKPSSAEFGLIWGLLFHGETCSCVKRGEGNEPVNWKERNWGMVLDLVKAHRTPTRKELTLLWLFPISFKTSGED